MARVSHPDAKLVITGNFHDDALQKFRQVRVNVETVTAGILACQENFPVALVYFFLYTVNDEFRRSAF